MEEDGLMKKKEKEQIEFFRHVTTGRDAKRIASMFRKAGGEKIKTSGRKGNWVVSTLLTPSQAAKFLGLECEHEMEKGENDGQM